MTAAAWIMLALTWTVVLGLTTRFLWLAVRRGGNPQDPDEP